MVLCKAKQNYVGVCNYSSGSKRMFKAILTPARLILSSCVSAPRNNHKAVISSTYIQWCAIEMEHLLHKPYVNEVTLNGQNLFLKSG